MHKEPLSLYIFRLLIWLGLLAFMAMLYWSSNLIEADLKNIDSSLTHLKSDILSLRIETEKTRKDVEKKSSQQNQEFNEEDKANSSNAILNHASKYPNLLVEDPFYQTTLPKMLGKDFKPYGIRQEATIGRPDNLHPFSNWSETASWISLCTVGIANQKFGIYETFVPEMALRMELRQDNEGKPEYWLLLRRDVFWQPLQPEQFAAGIQLAPHFLKKHQVTAHDFKFYLDAIMNPHIDEAQAVALRTYYNDIEEIKVIDDFTLVIKWKTHDIQNKDGKVVPQMKYMSKILTTGLRPLAAFVYQYFPDGTKIVSDDSDPNTYRTNSVWAQNFSKHWAANVIISCGPWTFDGMTDREIRFRRNPDFYDPYAVLVEALEVKFKSTPDAIWEAFKAGSFDLFQVPPNQLVELESFLQSAPYKVQEQKGLGIRRLDFVGRSYSYIGWNEARPFFTSKKVRQALTMAVDRQRIIQQNLNGMGIEITGTFFKFSPSYDPDITPYPFDPQKARLLLAEEGWYDSDGDGIIDKEINGKRIPFEFTVTYYVKNATTKSICEYVTTALKEVGILAHPNGVDIADLSALFEDKNFDAVYLGWGLGTPPEDPKQLWYSEGAKEKGSSNAIGFSHSEIDAIINALEYEYDPQKRIELYHRFDRILYDEAPYIFLYTPKTALIYREYLQNVFIPAQRQELIPGANVAEPQSSIFTIKNNL